MHTETGSVVIDVPRDREGTFEPQVIGKHQRRLEGFDEKVLALYARGMTTRDISAHLRELYGTDVSHELISKATEHVVEEFRAWQKRPPGACYPVVYVDAMFVGVRDGSQVKKRAFYVVLGMGLDGRRDVLGLWVAETEGAKFWLEVFTDPARPRQDVLVDVVVFVPVPVLVFVDVRVLDRTSSSTSSCSSPSPSSSSSSSSSSLTCASSTGRSRRRRRVRPRPRPRPRLR